MKVGDAPMRELQGVLEIDRKVLPCTLELHLGNSDRIWTEAVKAFCEFDNGGISPAPDFGQNRVYTALGLALLGVGCALDEALKFSFGLLRISHDAE
jgi:hypothetical protein